MISDLNFHLTIRTILQGENFLFSKENEDTYNPKTNGDSFVFFFMFCALAALPTTPVDFFDNSSADCCVVGNADQAVGSTKRLGIHSRLKFTDVGRIEE